MKKFLNQKVYVVKIPENFAKIKENINWYYDVLNSFDSREYTISATTSSSSKFSYVVRTSNPKLAMKLSMKIEEYIK